MFDVVVDHRQRNADRKDRDDAERNRGIGDEFVRLVSWILQHFGIKIVLTAMLLIVWKEKRLETAIDWRLY